MGTVLLLALSHSTSSSHEDLQICLRDADGVQDADMRQLSLGAERVKGRCAPPELPPRPQPRQADLLGPRLDPEIRVSALRHGRLVNPGVVPSRVKLKGCAQSEGLWRFGNPGRLICQGEVAGSNPVFRSKKRPRFREVLWAAAFVFLRFRIGLDASTSPRSVVHGE